MVLTNEIWKEEQNLFQQMLEIGGETPANANSGFYSWLWVWLLPCDLKGQTSATRAHLTVQWQAASAVISIVMKEACSIHTLRTL